MRVNLPVVAREYPFPAGETLVSTTDLQGRILYCNRMFVEVSGYAKEELLGQPHNIVRHPDMPEEAYRDMWETIGKGIPWSAPVKNRRKDGTYYWVMANVTPLMEGDQPVGYMSVRTQASRDQIQQAEQLYKTMQAEKQAGVLVHGLRAGRVVKNNLWGRVSGALRMGALSKMLLGMGVVVAAAMAAAQLGGQGLTLASGLAWLGVVALAVCYCVYMHSVLVSPLQQMLKWANRMAAGDLTQKITVSRDDTVGHLQKALSQLNVNLMSIVRDARQEAEHMQLSTQEIAQGNQDRQPAPSLRPATWSKRLPRWKKSPVRCARLQSLPARLLRWPRRPLRQLSAAARPSTAWQTPCTRFRRRRAASAKSRS